MMIISFVIFIVHNVKKSKFITLLNGLSNSVFESSGITDDIINSSNKMKPNMQLDLFRH